MKHIDDYSDGWEMITYLIIIVLVPAEHLLGSKLILMLKLHMRRNDDFVIINRIRYRSVCFAEATSTSDREY